MARDRQHPDRPLPSDSPVSAGFKHRLKRRLPFVASSINFVRRLPWRHLSMEGRFTRTHRQAIANDLESLSGPGSTLEATRGIRAALPRLVGQLGIRSILDIPCGDFHWMKEIVGEFESYTGADLIKELVESNRRRHGSDRIRFERLDLTNDELPRVDLVLCRDCLVHLSNVDVRRALDTISRSRSTYLLTTTFPLIKRNTDIVTGEWRRLNLRLPPFELPEPIELINEQYNLEKYRDKSLALWRIADL